MKWVKGAAVAAASVGAGIGARRLWAARSGASSPHGGARQRWHVVTVNRPQEEVAPGGRAPEGLAVLSDLVEMRFQPAPGGRGTEIAVRLRGGEPSGMAAVTARLRGDDPRWVIRRALRDTKQMLETGEVLNPSQPSTAEPTLLNQPLAAVTRHGKEEGRL